MKRREDNIDAIRIVFYAGIDTVDSTLVVMKNKKVIKEFFGEEAEKLYLKLVS